MSNVLEFLERVGQDWRLRHAEPAMLAQALSQAGIETSLHQAILDHDSKRLQALLNLSATVCCAVHPAHEDEDDDAEEDEDLDDDDDDDDLDDDDDDDDDDDEDLDDEEDDEDD
jgi:phosphopantothenoylcysteine synthetase/decarboxylase